MGSRLSLVVVRFQEAILDVWEVSGLQTIRLEVCQVDIAILLKLQLQLVLESIFKMVFWLEIICRQYFVVLLDRFHGPDDVARSLEKVPSCWIRLELCPLDHAEGAEEQG